MAYQWVFEVSDVVIEHITSELRVAIPRKEALGVNKCRDWNVRNEKQDDDRIKSAAKETHGGAADLTLCGIN